MIETLENLINDIVATLYADPIYLVIAVILSGLLIFSFLKKLIKVAIYVLALVILYIGYLYFTGESIEEAKESIEEAKEGVEQVITKVKDGIENSIDDILPEK
tara:strand:+ start:770 stop:1078 length:309 start_codon:yes stop_codon:yes gene_type:complete